MLRESSGKRIRTPSGTTTIDEPAARRAAAAGRQRILRRAADPPVRRRERAPGGADRRRAWRSTATARSSRIRRLATRPSREIGAPARQSRRRRADHRLRPCEAAPGRHAAGGAAATRSRRPLHNPGEQDLTAHVDFEALANAAAVRRGRRSPRPVDQGEWLKRLGIGARAAALTDANPERAAELAEAVQRLTGAVRRWASCSRSWRFIRPAGRRRQGSSMTHQLSRRRARPTRPRSTACSAPASATRSPISTAPEDLDAFLGKFTPEAWRAELADERLSFRLAEADGEPVGFVKLGPLTLPVETAGQRSRAAAALYPQGLARRGHRARADGLGARRSETPRRGRNSTSPSTPTTTARGASTSATASTRSGPTPSWSAAGRRGHHHEASL